MTRTGFDTTTIASKDTLFSEENIKNIASQADSARLSRTLDYREEVLQLVIQENFKFRTTREVYDFVGSLFASSQYATQRNWASGTRPPNIWPS